MTTAPTVDWLSPQFLRDPYPFYAQLREEAPVHRDPLRGVWMVMRYHDAERVLRDTATFSARQGNAGGGTMLVTDPPEHTRLRSLVSQAFTPRRVAEMAPRIEAIVRDLLDRMAGKDEFDAIAEFAYPLPITVIAELLGVDPERRDFFRAEGLKVAYSLGPSPDPEAMRRVGSGGGRDNLFAYFEELIEKRRKEPRDDLISALTQAEMKGDVLTHAELLAMLFLLLVGGHETTVNLIGNGLLALLRHPEQLALLRARPELAQSAVEELLRYDSPVQYSGRVCVQEVELSGVRIRPGEAVRAITGSANHDPAVFAEPDALDITREPNPHLAFGTGIHHCLGAALARLEGRIAIPAFLARYPRLALATDDPHWRPALVLRGLEALPLRAN